MIFSTIEITRIIAEKCRPSEAPGCYRNACKNKSFTQTLHIIKLLSTISFILCIFVIIDNFFKYQNLHFMDSSKAIECNCKYLHCIIYLHLSVPFGGLGWAASRHEQPQTKMADRFHPPAGEQVPQKVTSSKRLAKARLSCSFRGTKPGADNIR